MNSYGELKIVLMDLKPSIWLMGLLSITAQTNSPKGVKVVLNSGPRLFDASISSLGRQRSIEASDSRNWSILTASAGAALRVERRGALFGSEEARALRFLLVPLAFLSLLVLVAGVSSLDSVKGEGQALASLGFSAAELLV